MKSERFIQVLALALPVVLLLGLLGPKGSLDQRDAFYKLKTCAPAAYDVVLVGDSRVNLGLSPAAMESVLPGSKVLNFGYDAAGFSEPYLRAAASKLAADSPAPTLVLGISPLSLTERALTQSRFVQESTIDCQRDSWLARSRTSLDAFFTPYLAEGAMNVEQGFYPDGWSPNLMRRDEETARKQVEAYISIFSTTKVSERLVDQLASAVRGFVSGGLRVAAFRTPVSREVGNVEDTTSGFDESALVRRVTAAGARWIPVDALRYEYIDGSHVLEASARQLSVDLALRLAAP